MKAKAPKRTPAPSTLPERPVGAAKTLPLLVEVGCEEIPARFLADAERQIGERLQTALNEARLLPVGAVGEPPLLAYSTPRRLAVYVPQVLGRQPDKVEEVLGPPVKVALDAQGKPTRAAESFAQKNAARVLDLLRVTTAKGEYMALRKTTHGCPALDLLREILPAVITGLSFPKSLYWVAKSGPRFVRPIRWLVALLGEGKQAKVVPCEIAGVKSGNLTYVHRALGRGGVRVAGFKDYVHKLLRGQVEIHPQRRREVVGQKSQVLLEKIKLTIVQDKELLDWTVNSCEWPTPLRGDFEERFLRLPREILVTVMRDHQKYFAVEDSRGSLKPHFVAVLNLPADAKGLIRQGHERVLSARFSDAEFFWNSDQRVRLEERGELLAGVTYEAELGSYAEKVRRTKAIASHICEALEAQGTFKAPDTQHVLRAVELAKCDLTTQMVQEFPELQGVVGGLYAAVQGEPREVHEAIYDHYLPRGTEDRCPRSLVGALVSLADKLDSVVGGFAVGHEPTGSSDPFALRRQGNAIVKVLLEYRLAIGMRQAIQEALNVLDIRWRTSQMEVFQHLLDFFAERLRYYFETVRSFRYDTVRAVLAAGWDVPIDALARAEGLEAIRGGENLEALAQAAKRIKNILDKSATSADWEPGEVDAGLLKEKPEQQLYHAYGKVTAEAETFGGKGEYRQALEAISSLRPVVDTFFDKVLVMAEEPELRRNRLRLLNKLDTLFSSLASFAEIALESKS